MNRAARAYWGTIGIDLASGFSRCSMRSKALWASWASGWNKAVWASEVSEAAGASMASEAQKRV